MIRNIILTLILLAQVAVWFVIDPPWSNEQPASAEIKSRELDPIAVADVGAIQVVDPNGAVLNLSLLEGVWTIDGLHGFPALPERVEKALAELATLDRSDYRTDKRFLHEDLRVDDRTGQKVRLFTRDRTPLLDLIIGKQDIQGRQGAFIRVAGSDDVFVSPSPGLATAFDTNLAQWHDRAMMDVPLTDAQRLTELRSSCRRIEIEAERPKRGDNGLPLDPPQTERVRFVFERVDPSEGAGDPFWRVLEPEGKEDLVLDDLLVKGLAGLVLGIRASEIVGPGLLPEHGLDDRDRLAARVVATFKEGEVETSRVLEVGAETKVEPAAGVPRPPERFARVRHPGDPRKQAFVFTIHQGILPSLQRDPETYRRQEPVAPANGAAGR